MLIGLPAVPLPDATVRLTVAVCAPSLPVPVIVSVTVPTGVLLPVAIVKVELLPALTVAGLNVPVAPVGNPVTFRLIVSVELPTAVVLTVYGTLLPGFTVCTPGVADNVKSIDTTSVTVAVCVSAPLVPLIVSV
jgi:hypothetical protein